MHIQKSGSNDTLTGSKQSFTGKVLIDYLFYSTKDGTDSTGAIVTFEPGARSHWHTHPKGQILIVTSGKGLVQAEDQGIKEIFPGDVIIFEPGEKHWHGATPTNSMSHIAIQEEVDGSAIDWLGPVSDEQYLTKY